MDEEEGLVTELKAMRTSKMPGGRSLDHRRGKELVWTELGGRLCGWHSEDEGCSIQRTSLNGTKATKCSGDGATYLEVGRCECEERHGGGNEG